MLDLYLILVKRKYNFILHHRKAMCKRTVVHAVLTLYIKQCPGADHYCSRRRTCGYENVSIVPIVIKKVIILQEK